MINKILLFLFILFLPTQLGKHFFLPFSYLSGVRVDYLAPTIYLTDILAFLLIIFNLKIVIKFLLNKKILLVLGLLLINVVFSLSPYVSIYQYIKTLEWLGVFAVFVEMVHEPSLPIKPFLIGGIFEIILVILQFINKHSIQGIFYFFGERYFNLSTPGIAKATLSGIEFLRPYGTFSHPNSMGGFYLLVYFYVTIFYKTVTRRQEIFKLLLLFVYSLLIFFSFSKIAIISFLILNILYLLKSQISHPEFISGSVLKQMPKQVRHDNFCRPCVISRIIVLIILSLIFLSAQTDPLTIQKRLTLITDSFTILKNHWLIGTGLGAYLVAQNKIASTYSYFFLQPVHNIFLLFLTETGVIMTGIIGWLGYKFILKRRDVINHVSTIIIVLVIIFTGFFDHYWLTLQQNFLLLPVVLGIILSPGFLRQSPNSND